MHSALPAARGLRPAGPLTSLPLSSQWACLATAGPRGTGLGSEPAFRSVSLLEELEKQRDTTRESRCGDFCSESEILDTPEKERGRETGRERRDTGTESKQREKHTHTHTGVTDRKRISREQDRKRERYHTSRETFS